MYKSPRRIDSNYAREYRFVFAFCASLGWITVLHPDGTTWGRDWRVTPEGLYALNHHLQQRRPQR